MKYKNLIIGIVIIAVIAGLLYFYEKRTTGSVISESGVLTDADFEIINVSWNNYRTYYDLENSISIANYSDKFNWADLCTLCHKYPEKRCNLGYYQITTKQTQRLLCTYYYNGIQEDWLFNITARDGWVFNPGITPIGSGREKLDVRKDNEIEICCAASNPDVEGTVCKSTTLSAKCI